MTAITTDGNTIVVSWGEVPSADRNGLITGYIIFYREAAAADYTSLSVSRFNYTISGLKAAAEYILRVLAYTTSGNGIPSDAMRIHTQEKGMMSCIVFYSIFLN